jgi:hypothetical protein
LYSPTTGGKILTTRIAEDSYYMAAVAITEQMRNTPLVKKGKYCTQLFCFLFVTNKGFPIFTNDFLGASKCVGMANIMFIGLVFIMLYH